MSSSSALDLWEFEFLATELDQALEPARAYYKKARPYETQVPAIPLEHRLSLALFESLLQQLTEWASSLGHVVKQDMTAALGPEGMPGDADALKASAEKVGYLMAAFTNWEDTVISTWPVPHWQKAFELLQGSTVPVFTAMERLLREIRAVPGRARRGETSVSISVDIAAPSGWHELPKAAKEAIRTGGSFIERHPIVSGLIAGELLSRIFR